MGASPPRSAPKPRRLVAAFGAVAVVGAFGWAASAGGLASLRDLATGDEATREPGVVAAHLRGLPDAPAKLPVRAAHHAHGRPDRTYNVLLITIDTLRADLGFAGYPRPVTPNLDALAERSTVFERAYATASYTPKALGPLLIGKYASETTRDYKHYTSFFPRNVFVAERIRGAGDRTFAAMCHRYFSLSSGLDQGFELWDTSATPPNMTDNDPRLTSERLSDVALALLAKAENTAPQRRPPTERERKAAHVAPADHPDGGAPPEATAAGPARFFGWFHYFDPHTPYVAHEDAPDFAKMEPHDGPRARNVYDQEVWYTDAQIGRVLDYVASQPWGDETAVIITADHGEAFGEHGHLRHGRELWEPLVHVPLIVHVPGATPRRIQVRRSHIDLAPTILDLMGVDAPEGELRGASLLADVFADPDDPLEERDTFIDMPEGPFNEMRRALITGPGAGQKLIDFAGRAYQLYDLDEDPTEAHDLARDRERRREAVGSLKAMRARLDEQEPAR